ncbi:MAG: tetratricopeptide repeat protein [Fuerstiella sp.]
MKHLSQFRSFRSVLCSAVLLSLTMVGGTSLNAEEPFVKFLDGLRERKFFDTAIEHLDQLDRRTDLATESRTQLSLQRGLTYEAEARASRVVEDRDLSLGKAEIAFRRFLEDNPKHPQAAFANSTLGSLLFERARSIMWDADAASNEDRRPELQKQARGLIDQAEQIFEKALNLYQAQYKAFPPRIDKDDEPEQYLARQAAEISYLRAWFSFARAEYQRGQTYDLGSQQRDETLLKAFDRFEEIHTARRSNPIGLQARLMMGKCFQEQGDMNRALGIYNELTSNDSTNGFVKLIKSNAIQFRLICLNDESKKDYQLVLQESDEWLNNKQYRTFHDNEVGLGIRWEKAIALEKLSQDRTAPEPQQKSLVRAALADSKKIALYPSPYRAAATAMSRRLQASLGDADADPTDFETAFERAKGLVSQLRSFDEKIKLAKNNSVKRKAQQEKQRQWDEIARLLKMALDLREPDRVGKDVAQTRYLLGHAFLSQRKSYEALIIARYCMIKDRAIDPDSARDATGVAIQAAVQAFNDAGEDQSFELQTLKDICETIIDLYPNGSRGNEARYRLGKIYRDLNQPDEAAKAYLTIPEESSEYASARIQAGQSLWLAWAQSQANIGETDTTAEQEKQLAAWKQDATKYLKQGIQAARQKLGPKAAATSEMVAAEVTLASINNLDGKFKETVTRLTAGGAASVIAATEPGKGKTRPESGIQSASFAGQMWRQMLRAYVGTQQIDNALQAMAKLESVGGQDTTAIYTELGRELQQELARLKESGKTKRLQEVRTSFEQFLSKVYEKRDKTDYNSLLWIGETYFSLGQAVGSDDQAAADAYLTKAGQAYSEILDNNLADDGTAVAVRLRLARCQRALREYESALDLTKTILTERIMQLDVQFEAAHILADWGSDPAAGEADRIKEALGGIKGPDGQKLVWGWQTLATRLNNRQGTDDWEGLKPKFMDASYESLRSRLRLAETGIPERDTLLSGAKAQAEIFAVVNFEPQPEEGEKLPDDEPDFQRFNRLYEQIQVALGEAPQTLERDTRAEIPTNVAVQETPNVDPNADAATAQQDAPVEPEPANYLLITIAVGLAAGGGFAFYKIMSKPEKKRPTYASSTVAPVLSAAADDPGFAGVPGADDAPDFSGLGAVSAPSTTIAPPGQATARRQGARKPSSEAGGAKRRSAEKPKSAADQPAARATRKKVARSAPAADGSAQPGAPVKKKKRVLTPEEMVRYKAAKLAKAKAAAKQAAAEATGSPDGAAAPRKVAKKRPAAQPNTEQSSNPTPEDDGPAVRKKLVKKRPPKPPTEES